MSIKRIVVIGITIAISLTAFAGTLAFLQSERVDAALTVKYVAPNAACGVVGPCFATIQEAVDASTSGDVIKVSQGTYTSLVSNVVTISKALTIMGGFSIIEWAEASPKTQPTIIDGENSRRGIHVNGEHGGDTQIVLTGITVQRGHAVTDGGGGMIILGGDVKLEDSLITSNTTEIGTGATGGGLYIFDAEVNLTGNTIENNRSAEGGGISVGGGGNVTLSGNIVRENEASKGGGLSVFGGATVNMFGNSLMANEGTLGMGPGILLNGGLIYGENDIIAENGDSTGDGEGVNIWTGTLTGKHWTFVDNDAFGLVAGNGTATLVNTIVASHTVAGLFGDFVTANWTVFFNNTSNCSSGAICNDNVLGDPNFVNPAAGDYHIGGGSAALDAGIDAGVYTDIDGDPRPAVAGFDIGADERIEYPHQIPFVLNVDEDGETVN